MNNNLYNITKLKDIINIPEDILYKNYKSQIIETLDYLNKYDDIKLILKNLNENKNDYELLIDNYDYFDNDEIPLVFNELMKTNENIKIYKNEIININKSILRLFNKSIKKQSIKKPSSYELIIKKYLDELKKQNKILYYEWEKILPVKYKMNLRADFFIIDNNKNKNIIEYDSIIHFKENTWTKGDKFKDIQKRDKIKNKWCKQNNIPLLRITDKNKYLICNKIKNFLN